MLKASRNHLDEVQETYFEHLRAALTISGLLAKAGIACAVHAIVPGVCTRTATGCIARLSSNLNRRGVPTQL
jgi:glutaminase